MRKVPSEQNNSSTITQVHNHEMLTSAFISDETDDEIQNCIEYHHDEAEHQIIICHTLIK